MDNLALVSTRDIRNQQAHGVSSRADSRLPPAQLIFR
jgi:hypothetical protein